MNIFQWRCIHWIHNWQYKRVENNEIQIQILYWNKGKVQATLVYLSTTLKSIYSP
jgi:hypothetical protein